MSSTSASRRRKRCTTAALRVHVADFQFVDVLHRMSPEESMEQTFADPFVIGSIPLTWTLGVGRDRSLCIRMHPFKVLKRCVSLSAIQPILWHENHFVESTTIGAIYLHFCIQEDAFIVNSKMFGGVSRPVLRLNTATLQDLGFHATLSLIQARSTKN